MAGNPDCCKDSHNEHMCALIEQKYDKQNPEHFKKLTDNPKFKCGNCGAETKNPENLCDPLPI